VSVVLGLDLLAGLMVLVLLAVAALFVRRRVLTRSGGTFDCSLRLREGRYGKGWVLGIGRYAGEDLEWFRVFSYATRPRRVLARSEVEVLDRRVPRGPEVYALLSGAVIVQCRDQSRTVEVAMSEDALTGFLSWVESAPPGRPR
jgi:hypothetical protein